MSAATDRARRRAGRWVPSGCTQLSGREFGKGRNALPKHAPTHRDVFGAPLVPVPISDFNLEALSTPLGWIAGYMAMHLPILVVKVYIDM